MVLKSKLNKMILFVMSAIVSIFIMGTVFAPVPTYATDSGDPNGIKVSIGNDGTLSTTIGGISNSNGVGASAWNNFIAKYKFFISGIAGVCAVTLIVVFIINFLKLAASAGNPSERSKALVGILWSGIAAVGLGAVALIVGFFYNAAK